MPAVTFPHGKLQPIVFRPRKLANATPILEDSLKTNARISPTLFAHRLASEDALDRAGTQNPDVDSF